MTEATQDVGAVLGIVGVSTRIGVHKALLQSSVDQDSQFTRRGGDRFGLADAEGQAAKNAPSAVCVRPRFMAARRRMAAARLADGCVRLLRSRPPEILLFGASVSQDVKCLSVGQRLMSVPISESSRSAL